MPNIVGEWDLSDCKMSRLTSVVFRLFKRHHRFIVLVMKSASLRFYLALVEICLRVVVCCINIKGSH